MANFHTWSEDKLKEYIRFVGKDPKRKHHDELVLKAVKIYSSDQQSLPRFEAHYAQPHGGPGQAPPAGGFSPPMPGAGNPYPSVAYPGAAPAAGQYPTPGANPYGGPQPGAPQYPTVDFTSPAPGGAGSTPPAASPYPAFPVGGAGMPPGGGPAAASNPYSAPGGAFPANAAPAHPYPNPALPSAPAASHNPYPVPGAAAPGGGFPAPSTTPYPSPVAPSAPVAPSVPSNPYPAPGGSAPVAPHASSNSYPAPGVGSPAPVANPYPAMGAGGSNPYPVPGSGALGAHGHSSGFTTPTPTGTQSPGRTQQHAPQQQHQHAHHQQHQAQQHQHQQRPQQAQQQHGTGRKKALLVGCNYPGTRAELKGCCTDVQHIEYLLRTRFGFQDITILRDDQHRQETMPTKRNILAQIDRLVHGAQAGDSLFFHFSGHGSQKRDYTGDESDGMNETLVPTDHERAGQLIDDELNKRLVNPLGPGVRLHALLDACHSGTGLDLPFITKMEKGSGRLYWVQEARTRIYKGTRGGLAVQFGACKDSQLAQDTSALSGGTHTGAATFLFIQSVEQLIAQQQPLTYGRIISEMLHQIKEFQKRQSGGRGLEEGGSTRAGMGGMLANMLIQGAMGSMAGGGGGGGAIGGLMSALLGGGGGMKGQTPQLSASDAFDLNMPMQL